MARQSAMVPSNTHRILPFFFARNTYTYVNGTSEIARLSVKIVIYARFAHEQLTLSHFAYSTVKSCVVLSANWPLSMLQFSHASLRYTCFIAIWNLTT